MRRASISQGFSLFEALIVLAIFGLMVVAVTPMFAAAVRSYATSERQLGQSQEDAALDAVLSNIVARAIPPAMGNFSDDESGFVLTGKRDEMTLVAPLPEALGPGLARFTLSTKASIDGRQLVLAWEPRLAHIKPGSVVLSDKLKDASFSYLGQDPLSLEPPKWASEAEGSAVRVRALRLQMQPQDPAGATTERVISLQIDRNVWCVFDPVSLDCRPGT